jgi:DEAD/DEAH box helicase domain-containing protein
MVRCTTHRDPKGRFQFVQIALESTTGEKVARKLEYMLLDRQYQKGPWRRTDIWLEPGVYCTYCLNERAPVVSLADEVDLELESLNDPPLLFRSAGEFRVADVWPDLVEHFGGSMVDYRDFPASPPIYGDLAPAVDLHPALRDALFGRILPKGSRLYCHQAEAINAVYRGENVTVVTATASGKTLCYQVPVLDSILKDPRATTLYLAPLNALVEDQLGAFSRIDDTGRDWERVVRDAPHNAYYRRLSVDGHQIKICRYDGGAIESYRRAMREIQPNIVITNPEMLHLSILGWSDDKHWGYLLENLRFVVIDELHTYRGIVGSSFANLMRRLRRLCHYLGASPQFICASATISNPGDLAEALTGRTHTVVSHDGAPRKLRRFVLWDATRSEDAINTDAKNLMQRLVGEHRLKTITFARSIPSVDAVYRYVAGELRDRFGKDVTLIREFKRSLKAWSPQQLCSSGSTLAICRRPSSSNTRAPSPVSGSKQAAQDAKVRACSS